MTCVHHWISEWTPGPVSPAMCKKCGKTDTWTNGELPDEGNWKKTNERHKMPNVPIGRGR